MKNEEVSQCASEEGIKYDAGKPRLAEMFQDFLEPLQEVAKVWEFGAKRYGKGNWRYVDNAINRYTNAMFRHVGADQYTPLDDESSLLHAAHAAWNALARLHFIIDKERTIQPVTDYNQCVNEEKYEQLHLDLGLNNK